MRCSSCDHDNRDGAKFCDECAAPLKRACASCGAELRPTAKFCDECGASLQGAALPGTGYGVRGTGKRTAEPGTPSSGPRETRKVISVVFADLMGSTALQEQLDPESVNRVMDAYYQAVRGPVETAGGAVVQLLGDGVLCAFGIPQIAEDDALRAVRAAVGVQQAFREFVQAQQWLTVPIGLRVAVNTGEVVVSDEHPAGIGDPLNVAARLQQEARDGEVLIGPATRRLVADTVTLERAGVFALKGRAETVTAYRVLSLERPTGTAAAPFVGRDEELARLTAVYETARAVPAARLAVLLGSPGLGKSRLIAEISRRLGDTTTVVAARCDAVGGATFAPVAEALRELLGSDVSDVSDTSDLSEIEALLPDSETDRTRIVKGIAALLAGSPASPEETFFVIRRFLAALARQKPVLLVIDDLQWAEPLLLDLVEHLIQWGSGVPLFVLVGARPELRDLRSSLATPGGMVSEVLTLSGLDAGAAMRLAANVIGAADLPAAVAAKVLATSEGNPLFVGELVRMLVDEGALERQGGRWIVGANLAALEMPPTIHALLAARIERLKPEERAVLERAAVVGRHFSRSAVAALLGHNDNGLDALLEALRRTELIEPDAGWFLGEPVLRFHHVLIRDAAYRRLLKGTRAELHERLANWIEEQVVDSAEHDEIIGWHLEQAHQLLRELGPLDANGRALGERAAKRLAAAGRAALARDDVPVAADLLGRALDRLDADDPARADLLLDCCEALLSAGDVGQAAKAIEDLARFATGGAPELGTTNPEARLRAWHTCFAGQLTVMTAPQELQATADAVAQAAADFAALGDAEGEAKAHSIHAQALARLGRVGACEAALDRALAAARQAGDRRRANAVLAGAPLAALWGPSPVTRASGRCLDVVRVLRITQGAPAVEATALSCQGVLEALRGRTDAARRMIASSRKMVEELGIAHRLFEADVFAGRIDLLEGDAEAAERTLRGAYDGLRELGLGIDAARAGALLGRALLAQERGEEADAVSRESETLAGDDLQAAIAWRGVRAQALAQRGEFAAAIELAQAAVAIAGATDALLDHADARLALAAALRAAGRSDEADREERRAVELWEAKGATLLAGRARSPTETAAPLPDAIEPRDGTGPTVERRIRPNAATAMFSRYEVAFAARDVEALIALHSEDFTELDHPTGASYGHAGVAVSMRKLMSAENPWLRAEHLATLGESLALGRRWIGAAGGGRFGVGPYDREEVTVCEVDARGRIRYVEAFAPDRLGDALVRLYDRYAESLPAGAERARAVATARAMVVVTAEAGRNIDELAAVISPGFESVDHRPLSTWSQKGGEAFVEHVRALQEVADDVAMPVVDVLALEPHAVLIRRMHSGTERVGGGSYERPHLGLFVTGADGRIERYEMFEDDCQAAALARFDEIAGSNASPFLEHSVRRRVRTNAATRASERFNAATGARDMAALAATYSDKMEVLYHPTGATYGKEADLATWRGYFRARHLKARHTPIATLGDSLALLHGAVSHAGIELKDGASVGPVEVDYFVLYEVDEDERAVRSEVFDTKHLGDAIACLFERQAELTPEGPERDRAVTIARSFRLAGSPLWLDSMEELIAPDAECVDHRTLGTWSARGAEAMVEQLRGLNEVASEFVLRDDDVLALDATAVLTRRVHAGTERLGGGNYERAFLSLFAFAADGRITRVENFDAHREAEALARFEESTTAAESRRPVRRIRPNTATRSVERFRAALVAGDFDTVMAVVPPHCEVVYHPTGSTFSGTESVASFRPLLKAKNLALRDETLATLGDSLALTLRVVSYEGLDTKHGPVGPVEVVHAEILDVDGQGRARRSEVFATDHLGDAIVRLYERHAELQPEGPERDRAAMTAQAVRAMLTPFELGRDFPDLVQVDHRILGSWEARGSDRVREQVHALHEVAEDAAVRDDDVLALEPAALLVRRTHFGTARVGGGAYERPHLLLMGFGRDGRLARVEFFDVGKESDALARFAEFVDVDRPTLQLAGEKGSSAGAMPGFANTATRLNEQFVAACEQRDWKALEALHAPSHHYDDRRRLMRLRTSVDLSMAGFRVLLEAPSNRWIVTPNATRGDRLVLSRATLEGEAGAGGGPVAIDYLVVDEIDDSGRFAETVLFDPDDLDTAYAELDRRWQAGEAQVHPVAAKLVADWLRCFTARDWDGLSSLAAADFVSANHRLTGWGTLQGPSVVLSNQQELVAMAPDAQAIMHHLRTSERCALIQCTWRGTHQGGLFESPFIVVFEISDRAQVIRLEAWDIEQTDEALARFAELARGDALQSSHRIFANAASRIPEQIANAWATRDWETFKATHDALHSPTHHYDDRRTLMRIRTGPETSMEGLRFLFDVSRSRWIATTLATRGARLALTHLRFEGDVQSGGGDLEFDLLAVGEVDLQGRFENESILFDPDDLDAACAELDARFAAGEGAAHPLALAAHQTSQAAGDAEDWSGFAALHATGFVYRDHRLLGWGTMDIESLVRALQSLFELSADARYRLDHLRLCSRGSLRQMTVVGTRDGGAFENPLLAVTEVDEDGKIRRMDTYDVEDHDRALARFDEIRRSEPSAAPTAGARNAVPESFLAAREDRERDPLAAVAKPNSAVAAMEHWRRTYDNVAENGNWAALRALHAPDMVFEDRRRLCLLSGGLDLLMAATRERIAIGARAEPRLVGTAGDRICVLNVLWSGGPSDAPYEIEYLSINEIDEDGRITAILAFESDDPLAAQREAWKRWAVSEPELAETLSTVAEACDVFNAKSRARMRFQHDEGLIVEDHRHAGLGRVEGGDAYADSLVALWELAPKSHLELGWFWPAIGPQGGIFTVRRSGEIAGGGDYESVYLALLIHAAGQWKRLELFELDDLDIARARFEELCREREKA